MLHRSRQEKRRLLGPVVCPGATLLLIRCAVTRSLAHWLATAYAC
jgi:hypothetical protein